MGKDNMELACWGDGTIRLAFWDSIHGEDKIYLLRKDGAAFVARGEPEAFYPVNLVHELRTLALRWKAEAEAREREWHAWWGLVQVCRLCDAWVSSQSPPF